MFNSNKRSEHACTKSSPSVVKLLYARRGDRCQRIPALPLIATIYFTGEIYIPYLTYYVKVNVELNNCSNYMYLELTGVNVLNSKGFVISNMFCKISTDLRLKIINKCDG